MDPDVAAVDARRKERAEEFGEWVAIVPIPWGDVLAAIPGDPIPRQHIERLHWDELGLVARRDSPEGREVIERTNSWFPGEQEKAAEAKPAAPKTPKPEAPKGGAS